ncbi:UDP-glycosyltransferase UGT4-like [Anastrepha obliqua]|uniref:UDP-glycosyltransferase UGT4-like n=1 Tax=Anastrepha obliqua TaxID=95512 RepID=UPI002409EBE5|nr:UDP-glycosyltransferase UGT4-like [Anastrepha obliqua]
MHSKTLLTLLVLAALLASAPSIDGAKILAVYAYPGKSHFMMHRVLISELVKNGHEVTMITAYTMTSLNLGSNYTEILIEPVYDYLKDIQTSSGVNSIFDMSKDVSGFLIMIKSLCIASTEHALKQPKVQAIINAKQTEGVYDLLLVEQFYQEAFLVLAHIYNIPVISTATFAKEHYMSQMFGLITPWSYVPHGSLPLTDQMSFWERVQNVYNSLYTDFNREFQYFPMVDAMVEKYFGHLPIKFPSVSAMEKNLSAILINNHTPLSTAGPTMDNMINVGGMHIYPPNPLPTELQSFLDGAENGAIYFSLGSQVESKDMPAERLRIFLDVFRNMKQRVLWKFENESIINLPANVMVKKWLPQSDILAHPNVRVFITHGGQLGTQEGVHYAVPMLGLPFYCDQHLNLKKAEFGGYAITLDFHTLTRDDLKNGLQQLLFNSTYRDTIKRISRIFHDRPMGPRETTLYWIEYVIRHKGARHLRAAGLDLKWYQFYLVDVVVSLMAAVILTLSLSFLLVRWIFRNLSCWQEIKQKTQ